MKDPKIVFLDCATVALNKADLGGVSQLGTAVFYDTTLPEEIAERIKDADVVVTNKIQIRKKELDAAKNLKLIALVATGYNNVDIEYAREKGVAVCNAGSYSTDAVAQQVFAYILAYASKVSDYDREVKNGDWIRSRLFCLFSAPTCELCGKTLGIFGYGAIGKRVACIANAFGMKVIACTRSKQEDSTVEFVDFERLLTESDFLTVHCPLTEVTSGLFNSETFGKMKKGLYFINTARGGVINEQDLCDALNSGHLAGAAVDVLTHEPMQEDCPLLNAKNVTITPHIAWAADETRKRLIAIVVENVRSFLNGDPKNKVN